MSLATPSFSRSENNFFNTPLWSSSLCFVNHSSLIKTVILVEDLIFLSNEIDTPVLSSLLSSRLYTSPQSYECLFLDCGELSSSAEFLLFTPYLIQGGTLLLHDIFYPKSIKNFLVATYLSLSPEWDVLSVESSTPQGALIARKLF